MARYANSAVLDNGLKYIQDNASKMLLLKAYTAGDSYATVLTQVVAESPMTTGGTGDYSIAGPDNAPRVLTVASKSGVTASGNSGTSPDLHIALTNGTDKVLIVTDETSNQQVTAGNTVNFPSFNYTSSQPAAS